MKKILCVLFLSLLIFGSALAADSDLVGVWYLNFVSMDGENLLNVADMGFHSDMTVNEDGTIVMTMKMGEEQNSSEGTWSAVEGGIAALFAEEEQIALFQDGFLVFDQGEDGLMVYGREEPGPGFEPAEPDKDAKAEDYEGTWVLFKVGMAGVGYFDWEAVAAEMGLETNEVVIKDGVMNLFGEETPVQLTLEEDGVMANRFENRDYSMLDTVAMIREDGTMTVEAMSILFVLEKVEEEK